MSWKKGMYSLLCILGIFAELHAQKFRDSQFSSEHNYSATEIKRQKIKALQIKTFDVRANETLAEAIKGDYHEYTLTFNAAGKLLSNSHHVVIDSIRQFRSRFAYSYTEDEQLSQELRYNHKDSLILALNYRYTDGQLTEYTVQDGAGVIAERTYYSYDLASGVEFVVYHNYLAGVHHGYVKEKPDSRTRKTTVYKLTDSNLISLNQALLEKLPLLSVTVSKYDAQDKILSTKVHNAQGTLTEEHLYSTLGDLNRVDKKYYNSKAELRNQSSFLYDKHEQLVATEVAVQKWVMGEKTTKLQKTLYKYNAAGDVQSTTTGKRDCRYEITKDARNNWVLIKEFLSDPQLGYADKWNKIYTRDILYFE